MPKTVDIIPIINETFSVRLKKLTNSINSEHPKQFNNSHEVSDNPTELIMKYNDTNENTYEPICVICSIISDSAKSTFLKIRIIDIPAVYIHRTKELWR